MLLRRCLKEQKSLDSRLGIGNPKDIWDDYQECQEEELAASFWRGRTSVERHRLAAPTSTAYALVQHVREWVRVVPEADGAPFPEERLVKGMDERDALTAVIGAFLTPTEAAAALRSRAYWWPGLQIRCTL